MHLIFSSRLDISFLLSTSRCTPCCPFCSFAQTLFSRFVHEMITVTDSNHDGKISLQEMRSMLKKIGADSSISDEDLRAVFDELGHDEDGESLIYADEIETILTQPSKQ